MIKREQVDFFVILLLLKHYANFILTLIYPQPMLAVNVKQAADALDREEETVQKVH